MLITFLIVIGMGSGVGFTFATLLVGLGCNPETLHRKGMRFVWLMNFIGMINILAALIWR